MAHPAFDVMSAQSKSLLEVHRTNGKITFSQTVSRVSKLIRDHAAASTKNPRDAYGNRPMSPWTRFGGVNEGVQGFMQRKFISDNNLYEITFTGVLASPGPYPGSPLPITSSGEAEALRAALSKFGANELQLGVAVQEVKSTVGLLGKYYEGANKLTGQLIDRVHGSKAERDRFKKFARNGWKSVPSSYLEYLFGIKPLADDLANAVQVLQDISGDGSRVLTLKGKRVFTDAFRSEYMYAPNAGPLGNVEADFNIIQTNRVVLRFELPSWHADRLPPLTPFRQAWETTRLSFVLDWVVPISSWLGGFEGLQLRPFFRDGTSSEKIERIVSGAFWDDPEWIFLPKRAGAKDYSYSRKVYGEFPTEVLFSLPPVSSILGFNQLGVGAALLGQKLSTLSKIVKRA